MTVSFDGSMAGSTDPTSVSRCSETLPWAHGSDDIHAGHGDKYELPRWAASQVTPEATSLMVFSRFQSETSSCSPRHSAGQTQLRRSTHRRDWHRQVALGDCVFIPVVIDALS